MVYSLTIKNDKGIPKQIYLTADSQQQLVRRACAQYCCSKDDIEILAEYKEEPHSISKLTLVNKYIDQTTPIKETSSKAVKLFADMKRRSSETDLDDYVVRHSLHKKVITCANDLCDYIDKYKFVKVYFTPGEKRGVKVLFVVYK